MSESAFGLRPESRGLPHRLEPSGGPLLIHQTEEQSVM
jgi:hypothetical protein